MASPVKFSHSRTLFLNEDGRSMRFYVRPGPVKRELSPLISHGGGILCRLQEPGVLLLAEPGEVRGPQYVSCQFVRDCVSYNERLETEDYRLLEARGRLTSKESNQGVTVNTACVGIAMPTEGADSERSGEGEKHWVEIAGEQHNGGEYPGSEREGVRDHELENQMEEGQAGQWDTNGKNQGSRKEENSVRKPTHEDENQTDEGIKESENKVGQGIHEKENQTDEGIKESENQADQGIHEKENQTDEGIKESENQADQGIHEDENQTDQGIKEAENQAGQGIHEENENQTDEGIKEGENQAGLGIHDEDNPTDEGIKEGDKQAGQGKHEEENQTKKVIKGGENATVQEITEGDSQAGQEITENWADQEVAVEQQISQEIKKGKTESSQEVEEDKQISPDNMIKKQLVVQCEKIREKQTRQEKDMLVDQSEGLGKEPEEKNQRRGHIMKQKGKVGKQLLEEDLTLADRTGAFTANKESSTSTPSPRTAVINNDKRRLFTREEDVTILTYVRDYSQIYGSVSGIRLWKKLEKTKLLKRSWQAMKERYRKHLVKCKKSYILPPRPTNQGKVKNADLNHKESDDTHEDAEDLQIFEIANMEFEVDNTPEPAVSLKDFVMGEDSAFPESQTQVDEVSSSPELSEMDGLQECLHSMMAEFNLSLCQVTQALLKNNGEVGSTRHFLRTGSRPDGYPIWVRKDDLDLQNDDASIQETLIKKYGADNVTKRVAFLAS
ncbi:telomeric repeat-binding factor 2-interacting protein 1 [Bombina bombina]|uniref:telomeric repeat-binding factor 2-interacting protein 1 n=1 Tax=Bombina bombina TaxID=8345 RepID=UPI00235AA979|nr:telomeric repeat-binding factor 2-interacting protein 1 [Bombina bombina]